MHSCVPSLIPCLRTRLRQERNRRTSRTTVCKSHTTAPPRPSSPNTDPASHYTRSPFHLHSIHPTARPHLPPPAPTQGVLHPYCTAPSSSSRSAHTSHPTPSSNTNAISSP